MKNYTPKENRVYAFYIRKKNGEGNIRKFKYLYRAQNGLFVFEYADGGFLVTMTQARFNYLVRISAAEKETEKPAVSQKRADSEELKRIWYEIQVLKELSADDEKAVYDLIGKLPSELYKEFEIMLEQEREFGEKSPLRQALFKDYSTVAGYLAYKQTV